MKNLYPQTELRKYPLFGQNLKLNYSAFRCLLLARISYMILLVFAIVFCSASYAQTGLNTFSCLMGSVSTGKTYAGPGGGVGAQTEYMPGSNNSFVYRFGKNSGYATNVRSVNGYMAGASSFSVIANVVTSVVMRRVNNAVVNGTRDILFFAGNRNPDINTSGQTNSAMQVNLSADYVSSMDVAFFQNNLLIGTDNIFSNQGNGNDNNNNIERVDVMIAGGYTIPNAQKYGFPILERGIYGVHDAFKIAVITATDILGNPTAYSNVVSVTSSNYNNSSSANPVADGTYNYFLFRRNGIFDPQVNQHMNNQGIGGVSFRFSDFGITDGTTIYGYSILPNDFNSTSGSDVVNYNNAARFPTNTSETVGGLDILAVLGIAMETNILPVETTSFTAAKKENKVALEWTTATEINNRGFAVERSANGKDWMEIGFARSKASEGSSTEKLQYSFNDNNPVKGINYYRLKQLDLDGGEKMSEIRSVSIGDKDANTIRIFPNPVVNTLHMEGIEPGAHLKLVDVRGAAVTQITAEASTNVLSVEKLNPGIYFLQIIANDTIIKTVRLLKM